MEAIIMKAISILIVLMGFGLLPLRYNQLKEKGQLHLKLENIESIEGSIRIAVFEDKSSFEKKEECELCLERKVHSTEDIKITLDSLSFGQYAIAIYHDQNDNDKLDKSLLGIPTEPYAFSNNPKVKWKAPSFEEVAFTFSEDQQSLSLTLKKWKKQ